MGRGGCCQRPPHSHCTGTDTHPVLAASMEQQAGPPKPRPARPSTHPQPKVSPCLLARDGRDPLFPSPSLRPALTPPHSAVLQEGMLWGVLAILSLLAGLAAGTVRTPHCNETLDAAPTPRGTATASTEDGVEVPLAWSQLHGACWGRPPCGLGTVARPSWARWP